MDKNKAIAILNNKISQGVVAMFMHNYMTDGESCIFKKDDKYYYADKSIIPFTIYGCETMIFEYDFKNQKVSDWNELFVDHTGKSLKECIEEFAGCEITKSEVLE